MSKAKKLSLSGNDPTEKFIYKPKDLIWAKMKGFTPWPAMIVEPPLDLLSQSRRANSRCVFFFGTRNFAWIEENNIKPFEGPWKDELAKVAKPASFRHAMTDINKYISEPDELNAEIDKSCGMRSPPTEADFDKLRGDEDDAADEHTNNDEVLDASDAVAEADDGVGEADADADIEATVNNGEVLEEGTHAHHVVGSPDEYDLATGGITPPPIKSPVKRTPKAKSSAAAVPKSAKTGSSKSSGSKRRASQAPGGSSAAKRNRRNGSADNNQLNVSDFYTQYDSLSPSSPALANRRKLNSLHNSAAAIASSSARRANNTIALLNRPVVTRPEQPTVDMNARSQTLLDRDITPSSMTFGFLGLGMMGSTIVKNLLYTGHRVVVWNRTIEKCQPFADVGADVKDTPMDVVEASDIIFCCVSDPKGAKDLVFGNCGVLQMKDLRNKAYVEMSTIDPETSLDIGEGIKLCNGRYMEAQIHGTRQEAEDGMLIILAGGDRTVFDECQSCFKTIAKNTFFLGEIGNACKVNLILQTIMGVSLAGLSEALALADRFSISLNDILDIFALTSMKSPLLLAKGKEMAKGDFNPQQPLSHMQRDLRLVLSLAENLDQSMPVTGITNEVFKHTKRLGYSEHDSSAVFVRSRF